jgi:hypothetical protein
LRASAADSFYARQLLQLHWPAPSIIVLTLSFDHALTML